MYLSKHLPTRLFLALAGALLTLLSSSATGLERRIALVIGNSAYVGQNLPKLANPANDAEDVAKALRKFGFQVIEKKNLTQEGMNRAIAEFGSKIGGSDAALFFYAGHGIQVKNQNYLIPVNASIDSEAAVPYQGINLNQVLDEMDNGKSGANIVILDACRNNPITGKFRSGQTRGLAAPGSTPKGTVIVYATDPGNVAADGDGRNGLFTAGLLSAFRGQDLSLDGVLTEASALVEKASGQTQTPYVNGPKTLQKNFHFKVTIELGKGEIEKTFWNSIEHSSDPADFAAYLSQYPTGSYVRLAENRIKALKEAAKPSASPTTNAFDGRWNVSLVCDDLTYRGRPIKGYAIGFPIDIRENRITGQYGQAGQAASLTMTGSIRNDGTTEITVNGQTGNPDLTVGGVARNTPYTYHLRGSFSTDKGLATRVELRPCQATFTRE